MLYSTLSLSLSLYLLIYAYGFNATEEVIEKTPKVKEMAKLCIDLDVISKFSATKCYIFKFTHLYM